MAPPPVISGYRLIRELGRGGMATVWLAVQESLGREVALKLLSPALAADPDASERFLREGRIAARLVHRHIVGIHDVGMDANQPYMAMEYLPGGAVATDVPTPPALALGIVREIALALDHAHRQGVIHRDLKPENILRREDGSHALADFGIARLVGPSSGLTQEGVTVGTPHYMSPEQLQALPLDGRSDLYSLGVVLYQLLTGNLPYRGTDGVAVGTQHIHSPIPRLPESLQRYQALLDRLLAKAPDQRPATGAELARQIEALRGGDNAAVSTRVMPATASPRGARTWAALALMLLVGGTILFFAMRDEPTASVAKSSQQPSTPVASAPSARNSASPSIAVLPFDDLSPAHDQQYLGDGLAEEILNQLAQVPALRLVGRASSFSFGGKHDDLREIGRKLGVAHLLQGSIRNDGSKLRVTAKLIRSDDGTQLWSKTYARQLHDVFAVQDEIARDVAQALSVKLDAVTMNRAQGGTTNLDAYDRYLRWRKLELAELSGAGQTRQQVQLAREAVALDPQFVLAWDALAASLRNHAAEVDGPEAEPLRAEAEQIANHIAELAPDSWVVKRNRAYALWRDGKHAEAIALAKQILDSGPLTVEHVYPYINLIFAAGHIEETIALADRVKAIEPLAVFPSRDQQWNLIAGRRYEEAESEYQRSLTLDGGHIDPALIALMRRLALKNADLGTLRELHRQAAASGRKPYFAQLGAALDNRERMLSILGKAAADPATQNDALLVLWLDALGDSDQAAEVLRKHMQRRAGFKEGRMDYSGYWQFWIAPYSGLRTHPEFKLLLIETGLVDYWRQSGRWGDFCKPIGTDDFACH